MNTVRPSTVEPSVAKLLDPYSNPRTIPGGWDVSAMQAKKSMETVKNPPIAEPNVAKMLDPFSNPRTIPGGWDVSAIFSPDKMSTETYGDSSYTSNNTEAPTGTNESA
jgi:hypothetical protein